MLYYFLFDLRVANGKADRERKPVEETPHCVGG